MSAQRTGGFSLIELVVVLAILAVLGAVAIPQVQQLREDVAVKNAAAGLASAAEQSFALQIRDSNGWPYLWRDDQDPNICEALNDPGRNLVPPTDGHGTYGIEIPAGYTVVPVTSGSTDAVTFSVPNATGGSRDSPTTSVTCALVKD